MDGWVKVENVVTFLGRDAALTSQEQRAEAFQSPRAGVGVGDPLLPFCLFPNCGGDVKDNNSCLKQ